MALLASVSDAIYDKVPNSPQGSEAQGYQVWYLENASTLQNVEVQ